jgi:hypothetical protein
VSIPGIHNRLQLKAATLFRYSRYVTKSVSQIDTMLKVIMTPEDPAEDFVNNYLVLIPCQSFSDFQKVLDLKVSVNGEWGSAFGSSLRPLFLVFALELTSEEHKGRPTDGPKCAPGRLSISHVGAF